VSADATFLADWALLEAQRRGALSFSFRGLTRYFACAAFGVFVFSCAAGFNNKTAALFFFTSATLLGACALVFLARKAAILRRGEEFGVTHDGVTN
jgi:hypothetical protein